MYASGVSWARKIYNVQMIINKFYNSLKTNKTKNNIYKLFFPAIDINHMT